MSKFIVCTDAGLASNANRKFNNIGNRAFITTQSIKKLKKHLKEWSLNFDGWHTIGDNNTFNLLTLDEFINNLNDEKEKNRWKSKIFYKDRWINENGLEQRLVVSFSFKYRDYQRTIRNNQIERAQKKIDSNPSKIGKPRQNDFKRFIKTTKCTKNGEIATKNVYNLNNEIIEKEMAYDGYYGVCTNLEDDVSEIIKINKQRWQIEDCFRIMKTEFKARPVYLSRDDRIQAHFTTCFIALIIYKLLNKKLNNKYTCSKIVDGLREMNFHEIPGEGYIPAYTRTDFTDDLHEIFNFRTDYQIVTNKKMKKILKDTKK
jgi:transposase